MNSLFKTAPLAKFAFAVLAGLTVSGLSSCDNKQGPVVDYSSYTSAIQADIDALDALVQKLGTVTLANTQESTEGTITLFFTGGTMTAFTNGGSEATKYNPPRLLLQPSTQETGPLYVWALASEDGSVEVLDRKPMVSISGDGLWEVSQDGGVTYESTGASVSEEPGAAFVSVSETGGTASLTLYGQGSVEGVEIPFEDVFYFNFVDGEGEPFSGALSVAFGESASVGFSTSEFVSVSFDVPEGWSAEISGGQVVVSAPADNSAVSEGEVTPKLTCAHVTRDGDVLEVSAYQPVSPVAVGDYYYSDGTYSSTLDAQKTVVGVVFYVGNPAVDDSELAADFPSCVNGLVVSLTHPDRAYYLEDTYVADAQKPANWYSNTSGITYSNCFYVTDYSTEATSSIDYARGYANTKVLRAYSEAVQVTVGGETVGNSGLVNVLDEWVMNNEAPVGTSGWFIPSTKEMLVLVSGKTDLCVFEAVGTDNKSNLSLVNEKLAAVSGAAEVNSATSGSSYQKYYWVSGVRNDSSGYERGMRYYPGNLQAGIDYYSSSYYIRPVFAF